MDAEIGPSLYVICAAVLMGWVMESFFTFAFAQRFHPVEQVWIAQVTFTKVARITRGVLTTTTTSADTTQHTGGGDKDKDDDA
jgi:hypothetical protein